MYFWYYASMTTQQTILAALAVAIVAAGGYYLFNRSTTPSMPENSETATTTRTGTPGVGEGASQSQTLNFGGAAPSLDRQLTFSTDLSAEAKAALATQKTKWTADLKKDPQDAQAWLSLGTVYKIAGDYRGAEEAWNWVVALNTSISYLAYNNLGDLYMNFLKDNAKAEASYKIVIALKPDLIDSYRNLYTLYRYTLKDDAKAAAILEQGLKSNPNNSDLLTLKQELSAQ